MRTCSISGTLYGMVLMMSIRSSRSTGTPCGAKTSVPRIVHTPRLVANITMGLRLDSSALFFLEDNKKCRSQYYVEKKIAGVSAGFVSVH